MSSRYGSRSVVAAGALAASVLVLLVGCERQSPRFDKEGAAPLPAVTVTTDAGGDQAITLQMTDLLRFEPSLLVVHPGKITVTLANSGDEPHTFEVPTLNVDTGNIPVHTTVSVTFTIPKGAATYAFDCAYHTSEHMVGTLTVAGS